jgi:hypothetical protein
MTRTEDDIKRGYTPIGARSRQELAIYEHFFRSDGESISLFVFVLANDGGSMQRDEHLRETTMIIDIISNNFSVIVDRRNGTRKSFNQFCTGFCTINEPIRHFYVSHL